MITVSSSNNYPQAPAPAPVRSKSAARRSTQNQPWTDIYATSKVLVSIQTRNLACPEMMIDHAQDDFLKNFGYSPEDLPLPMKSLFGKATIRFNSHRIQTAILTGKAAYEYQNLYKKTGQVLSCHIFALSLTGNGSMMRKQPVIQVDPQRYATKYAILTIRSASVMGNSVYSGIGFLGIDRVTPEKLAEVPQPSKPKKKSSSSSSLSTGSSIIANNTSNNNNSSKSAAKGKTKTAASVAKKPPTPPE